MTVTTTETEIVTCGTVTLRGKKTASARLVETVQGGMVTGWTVQALTDDGSWVTGTSDAWWTLKAFSNKAFQDLIHSLTMAARPAGTKIA